jgi:hypothetical protein
MPKLMVIVTILFATTMNCSVASFHRAHETRRLRI